MPKPLFVLVFMALLATAACGEQQGNRADTPKLVVMISIDQFPAWFLEEYAPALDKGFRTLTTEGRYYPAATVDHAPTLSGAGHGTIATGDNPSRHGFSANEWWEQAPDGTYGWVSIFEDKRYHFTGFPGEEEYSPQVLKAAPMAEWFVAQDPAAKVLTVGMSEVTLLYGERRPGDVFWFSDKYGVFGTSTFYADSVPQWVDAFNAGPLNDMKGANDVWTMSVPGAFTGLADRDDRSYEANGEGAVFPHKAPEGEEARNGWFYSSPFADVALLEFAKAGIEAKDLGRGETTDVLTIVLNSADNIGHRYGPHSLEMLDYLVRLDGALGNFIIYLDNRFGRDNYILALTSDHGVAPAPEYVQEHGGDAKRVTNAELNAFLDGIEDFIADYDGPRGDFPEALAKALEEAPFIADAMTRADLEGDAPADQYLQLYRNGHVTGKTTDFPLWGKARQLHPALFGVEVRFKEGYVIEAATGIHGSPYDYDREVPLIFFGAGIKSGIISLKPKTVDIAPTLAALAGVAAPDDIDGHALEIKNDD